MARLKHVMAVVILVCGGCQSAKLPDQVAGSAEPVQHLLLGSAWKEVLAERLRLYGHRNWIVIADSAYPAQSRDGIETIVTGGDQIEVVREVLRQIDESKNVKANVYTDAELKFVAEQDASGIDTYRKHLASVLGDRPGKVIPHEEVIGKLGKAGQTFRVLILKTDMTLPYTSVFLELDCAYWNAEAEQRLRQAMGK